MFSISKNLRNDCRKLKIDQCKSVLEYDTDIICRRHHGHGSKKIAQFTKQFLTQPYDFKEYKVEMLILEPDIRNVYFCN